MAARSIQELKQASNNEAEAVRRVRCPFCRRLVAAVTWQGQDGAEPDWYVRQGCNVGRSVAIGPLVKSRTFEFRCRCRPGVRHEVSQARLRALPAGTYLLPGLELVPA